MRSNNVEDRLGRLRLLMIPYIESRSIVNTAITYQSCWCIIRSTINHAPSEATRYRP